MVCHGLVRVGECRLQLGEGKVIRTASNAARDTAEVSPRWREGWPSPTQLYNMLNMSTHSLRDLRNKLGSVVREVAMSGEEAIVTDSGTEVAVIISMADYERLHEHADVADALRLRGIRTEAFSAMSLAEMMDALGVSADEVLAS